MLQDEQGVGLLRRPSNRWRAQGLRHLALGHLLRKAPQRLDERYPILSAHPRAEVRHLRHVQDSRRQVLTFHRGLPAARIRLRGVAPPPLGAQAFGQHGFDDVLSLDLPRR